MGLDISLNGIQGEEEGKSKLYPDHYWTPTYLRSSYNPSGFNRVVNNLTGMDLYSVFNPGNKYNVEPNWTESLRVAESLLELLKKKVENFNYRCESITALDMRPQDGTINSEEEALKLFERELKRNSMNSYSNAKGEFWLKEPIKVSALIRGTNNILGPQNCLYLVYRDDLTLYLQAAEILVKEFIPLGLKYRDTSYLSWSS